MLYFFKAVKPKSEQTLTLVLYKRNRRCRCVQVRSTGKIEGMVRYNDLKMEQGGHMVGDVQQGVKVPLGGM